MFIKHRVCGANEAKGRQMNEKKSEQRQRVRKYLIYDQLNYSILCMLWPYGFNFSDLWNTHTHISCSKIGTQSNSAEQREKKNEEKSCLTKVQSRK